MAKFDEASYLRGSKAAWRQMLARCLQALEIDDSVASKARWLLEREEVIVKLRSLCEDFGDNDWDDQENLADVIEKHLARHLDAGR